MSSGPSVWPAVGRELAGSIFCKPWSAIDSFDPGSEWPLHRQWFEQSAMGALLGEDFSLVEKNALNRCLDKVLKHKEGSSVICANALA
jgi:hypothetical protein